ncbi:MBL fold metallo-hydrolase [Archaeoglobales archaeon]|nr:MAG: MBL fold metallo-hydrolase [Archaeoglobales archaeon ex4484_92]RLI74238.1 MAG: MBL fold metallo-hydrolase [Archaeoglobales archaeon]
MNILEVARNLYLIDLPQKLAGFRKFISCWVVKDNGKALVVDIGPGSTVPKLVESLKFLGIEEVEYVLLTHIHIDHAGGLGHFLKYYPSAKVVVHEMGERHIVEPSKLWEGSLRVLGDVARIYEKPIGISPDSIYKGKITFAGKDVSVLKTPGHAAHHQCYIFDEFLFIGEAAGVHIPLKGDYYLRPATPSKFIFEIAYDSLERLIKIGSKRVCFGHFGFKRNSKEIAKNAMKQLRLWVDVVYDIACRRDFRDEKKIINQAKEILLEKDKRFARYHLLDDDIKKREDFFIENSLRGILEYVHSNYCEP